MLRRLMGPGRWFAFSLIVLATAACPRDDGVKEVPTEAPSGPPLVFGLLPAVDADAAQRDYRALLTELQRVVDRPTQLVVADSYDALVDSLVSGKVHVAQLSAYMVVRAKAGTSLHVVAQQRMGWDTEYRGVFVVAQKSPAKSLQDLAGKTIAYVSRGSSAGYFYPRMRLRELGLDPDAHFGRVIFAESHQKVAELVSKGEVDVGAISWQTLPEALNLRVIDRTAVIPDDAIVTGPSVSDADRERIKNFFLAADENQALAMFLNQRGIETFVRPDVDVYEPLEKEMGLSSTVEATADEAAPSEEKAEE